MSQSRITALKGRRVWDSRGRPTLEAEVSLASGHTGRAIAPAGASTGSGEALDLRDGGTRLGGLDISIALGRLHSIIAPGLTGFDASDQLAVDGRLIELDGTADKSKLGGNATIAVSMAVLHAAAAAAGLPLYRYLGGDEVTQLPLPEIQIFGGGAHAEGSIAIQDFLVVCPGASSFAQALEWTAEIYRYAGIEMKRLGRYRGIADEGGYWPAFDTNEEVLETLTSVIEKAGFRPLDEVAIALDVAASEFAKNGAYHLGENRLDTTQLIEQLGKWIDRYPIVSIEDPLAEDDVQGFIDFTARFGEQMQVVGDDLLVTSASRVRQSADSKACNSVLIKPNQRGTISETLACWQAAKEVGFQGIVSARSGESEDITICHLAIGWQVPQFKVGSFARSERMAKWNEMLRIEEAIGSSASFVGSRALN
ncbi:MAG: phosphopyruvate hydratase [Pseudomonadota bacterium]